MGVLVLEYNALPSLALRGEAISREKNLQRVGQKIKKRIR
jgi:hypothetical protein